MIFVSFVLMNLHLTGTPHATYICNVPRRPTWGRIGSTTATAETYGITVSTTAPTYGIHCSPTTLLPVTGFDDKWALPLLYGARGMDVLCLVTQTSMPRWHHFVLTTTQHGGHQVSAHLWVTIPYLPLLFVYKVS